MKSYLQTRTYLTGTIFLSLCLSCGSLAAQGGLSLEEVVVMARKMEESLQEAPVAVTAFSSADLAVRGVSSLDAVANYTPNVEFFASAIAGKSSGQAYIRGVGQFDYLLTTDPGVGIYIDGVYLARSLGSLLDLVDIERVEVLRGPQGTLYGKNTVGGAINVVTRRPGDDFGGSLEFKTGSYDRINVRGVLSGALVEDKLRAKVAFNTKNADGFGDRPLVGDRPGNEESHAVQGTLDWGPVQNLNFLFSADYTRVNEAFPQQRVELVNTSAPLVGLYNALAGPLAALHGLPLPTFDNRWVTNDAFVSQSTDSNFSDQEVWGISNTITWEIGEITVKSITGYRDMDISFGTDPDGSPVVVIDEVDIIHQEQFSQELQLSGLSFDDHLSWVAGFYYLSEDANADVETRAYQGIFQALEALPGPIFPLAPGLVCPAPPPAPCAGGAGNPVNIGLDIGNFVTQVQETQSMSLYGQASYAITDKLDLTYGLRYTYEEKDFTYSLLTHETLSTSVPLTNVRDSWNDISHRIGLDYQWTDTLMTYFSAAKGFKSGGFNGRGQNTNEIQSYEPEEIWTYELGFKTEWFDRRLRLNGAIFYNDYTDLQLTLVTADAMGGQLILVGNAATAEVKGFELEALAVPVDGLKLNFSLGYLDAEYKEVDPATGITEDLKLIGSPKWSFSLGGEYTVPVSKWGALSLRADYSYRSKVYFDAFNTEVTAQEAYGLVNFRATFTSDNERWSIATGVTNVTDEVYKTMGLGALDSLGFAASNYGRPREWFLQGNYYF